MTSFKDNGPAALLTVTELTRSVKYILEDEFPQLRVVGEISNVVRHSSGHLYFTLKDTDAQISCVMWRSKNSALLFRPEDGMKVVISGRLTVYERQGRYQLDADSIHASGRGELQQAFEAVKQKLADEGLFDRERKKPIPLFPGRIGIVTSPTGAAIQDIRSVISRRFPAVELILKPVRVQGPGAAEEIAEAVRDFNVFGEVDVLIVGRGGGSLEDLWPFNEECVARAVSASRIPVVSAVGHEIDFSICDFAADVRAPTPSAAGELVVPDSIELLHTLTARRERMYRTVRQQLSMRQERVERLRLSHGLRLPEGMIREYRLRIDELQRRLEYALRSLFTAAGNSLAALEMSLKVLDPAHVLQRGYSITCDQETGGIIRDSADVKEKRRLLTRFAKGTAVSVVTEVSE
ncbi:exodeoxyribonuclease VII large subunit [bacterium]|nr:exodeoxyribonuclease VII large subunit [bacterium]